MDLILIFLFAFLFYLLENKFIALASFFVQIEKQFPTFLYKVLKPLFPNRLIVKIDLNLLCASK